MPFAADSIWVNVSTSGVADFTMTTALAGYQNFVDAGVPNGSTVHYTARTATQFENGEGVYNSGTGVVTRVTIFESSNAGAKVSFGSSPTLALAPLAEDAIFPPSGVVVDNTVVRWDGTNADAVQGSEVVISDAGAMFILGGDLELGTAGVVSTPLLDFHSSANVNDYDSRIIASGGSAGVGLGQLSFAASLIAISDSVFIAGTTGSTSSASGALRVIGGVGIGENLNVGGAGSFTGSLNASGGLSATGTMSVHSAGINCVASNAGLEWGSTSAVNTPFIDFHSSGNLNDFDSRIIAVGGAASASQGTLQLAALKVEVPALTASTSSTTGALVVAGGVGIAGALNVASNAFFAGITSFYQGFGYGSGAGVGGNATQSTSKSTTVTLDKLCGFITMNAASLAADTTVSFLFNNTHLGIGDMIIFNQVGGGTAGAYMYNCQINGAGVAFIHVRNVTAGALAEAVQIQFAVIKGSLT